MLSLLLLQTDLIQLIQLLEDSEEDVLVLSSDMDVWELIEDELIMAVPLVPKHAVCPTQVAMSVADEAFEAAQEARPNPFAALAKLKQTP